MMYDYYARKLEAFWQRRKWWIIGVFASIVAAGITINFLPKTPEQRIKAALVDYHKAKGQGVEFQSLSFKSVSAAYPDSLNLTAETAHFNKCSKTYIIWFGLDDSLNISKYKDSLDIIEANVRRLDSVFQQSKNNHSAFIKCDYIAEISSQAEHFTDTFTVVLNDSLRVVWRR